MKQFFEFAAITAFVAVYFYTRDIYTATIVLMAGLTAQLIFEFLTTRKVEKRTLVVFLVAVVFGGATLIFRNELFIQWKPTIVNGVFAVALLASRYLFKIDLLQKALGAQLPLPPAVWRNLNHGWAAGFLLAGALNLVVAYNFSLDFWVTYKLIGGFGLTLVYIAITVAYLTVGGHLKEEHAVATPPDE